MKRLKIKTILETLQEKPEIQAILLVGVSIVSCLAVWYLLGWKIAVLILIGAASFSLVKTLQAFSVGPIWLLNVLYYAMIVVGPAAIALAAMALFR